MNTVAGRTAKSGHIQESVRKTPTICLSCVRKCVTQRHLNSMGIVRRGRIQPAMMKCVIIGRKMDIVQKMPNSWNQCAQLHATSTAWFNSNNSPTMWISIPSSIPRRIVKLGRIPTALTKTVRSEHIWESVRSTLPTWNRCALNTAPLKLLNSLKIAKHGKMKTVTIISVWCGQPLDNVKRTPNIWFPCAQFTAEAIFNLKFNLYFSKT
jgi:hypothetical protein